MRYLRAGKRPKKATKVTSDTVMVKMMMVRATVMVKEAPIRRCATCQDKERARYFYRDSLILLVVINSLSGESEVSRERASGRAEATAAASDPA
jgi:hypothetical protein